MPFLFTLLDRSLQDWDVALAAAREAAAARDARFAADAEAARGAARAAQQELFERMAALSASAAAGSSKGGAGK
jgi:hypothetical protein